MIYRFSHKINNRLSFFSENLGGGLGWDRGRLGVIGGEVGVIWGAFGAREGRKEAFLFQELGVLYIMQILNARVGVG